MVWYDTYSYSERETEPRWMSTPDAYSMKLRLPDLEPATVSAALSSDGTKIEVTGERKIEGCSCRPTTVKEIGLPYRPRAEDVGVTIKDGVLSLTLARHAKADAPTPIKVQVMEEPPAVAATKEQAEEAAPAGTRPLRFVPHASAASEQPSTAPSLQEQEKSLTDKFRNVALAAAEANKNAAENHEAAKATEQPETANASAEKSNEGAAAQ